MLRLPLQIVVAMAFTVLWRLAPFRPPNVEPVLATAMPFGKKEGGVIAAAFAVLSMVAFDLFTSGLTQWTAVTAAAYALITVPSGWFLPQVRSIPGYIIYAVIATIVYDALTGVVAGALLFDMGWRQGFLGQIPFTINHLLGNVILAIVLSPAVEWVFGKRGAVFSSSVSANQSDRTHLSGLK